MSHIQQGIGLSRVSGQDDKNEDALAFSELESSGRNSSRIVRLERRGKVEHRFLDLPLTGPNRLPVEYLRAA